MVKKLFVVLLVCSFAAGFAFAGGGGEKAAPAAQPAAPAAAPAAPAAQAIGASLIGKLEGPTFIRDTAQFPKTFSEAPMLAEQVKAGKLPAVAKRLPEPSDLLVIKPLREVGKYGGTWRRAFTGPADHENGNRIVNNDKILTFDYAGKTIAPALAKDWKISADGKITTI